MIVFIAIITVLGLAILGIASLIWERMKDRDPEYSAPYTGSFMCSACGGGPWPNQWWPEPTDAGNRFCPNCSGAD